MPLPGQNLCRSCLQPITDLRNEGKCNSCVAKEVRVRRAGNFCDHCSTNGRHSLMYANMKTKKMYCADCRGIFRTELINKGVSAEVATKIMIKDFTLVNDPYKKSRIRGRDLAEN